jgi:XapX domain-containing protein
MIGELGLALATGILVGIIFSVLKLPLPAPPVLSGIIGIFGIYLGGMAYHWIIERFFS